MFVVAVTATLTSFLLVRDLVHGQHHLGFAISDQSVAVVHRAVRQFRRSRGGRAAARPRRKPCAAPAARPSPKFWPIRRPRSIPRNRRSCCRAVTWYWSSRATLFPPTGEVVEGVASVDESAITGEKRAGDPGIRRRPFGGDRLAPAFCQILSWSKSPATQGSTFLDRMIALVEGAERQKTPNEIALNILLAGLTIIFVFAVATIPMFAAYAGGSLSVLVLVALVRDTDPHHHRRAVVSYRHRRHGSAGAVQWLAMSGRAVEAAGDYRYFAAGQNRHNHPGQIARRLNFCPLPGVTAQHLAEAAQMSSLADETPEGRSIVVLAKEKFGIRGHDMASLNARFIPFSAKHPLSGIDSQGAAIRKGAVDAVLDYVRQL